MVKRFVLGSAFLMALGIALLSGCSSTRGHNMLAENRAYVVDYIVEQNSVNSMAYPRITVKVGNEWRYYADKADILKDESLMEADKWTVLWEDAPKYVNNVELHFKGDEVVAFSASGFQKSEEARDMNEEKEPKRTKKTPPRRAPSNRSFCDSK